MYNEIQRLKNETDAVLLAHYYVDKEVQKVSDYVGDSYYLAKIAKEIPQKTILFSGVYFMGESAKILNPEKTVLLPELSADCPMAHMARTEKIQQMRAEIDDLAVVCYINSTAALKANCDVCVTSSNAKTIIQNLPHKNIFFIPDVHLGRYIASLVPEKKFYFNDGFCPVHQRITASQVAIARKEHPFAPVLAHPECDFSVLQSADYVGSTSGIIAYASSCDSQEIIIATEVGVLYELEKRNPHKKFFAVTSEQICNDMKKITLDKVISTLKTKTNQIEISEDLRKKALIPLNRMLELAAKPTL
ncbi:quinolinate synthase NadA [Anaerovorax sp. IOR16]|uniref:quinolinate synthase NadA n=1 Tax=Anaerovorax sp. IOR16 TaxID=2773458 RepID=UPI0019D0AF40|nr:quinolinate synthase NadA [Anaerovorax sp. IOR16]